MEIPTAGMTSIVGESGCGKSTVVKRIKQRYEEMGFNVHIIQTGHFFREVIMEEYRKMYPDRKDAKLADVQADETFASKRSEIDKIVDENASGILELQEKLSEIAGEQIQISYENGVLTLIQPGVEPRSFDLLKDLGAQFANKTDVDNLKSRFEVFSDTFVDTSRNAVQTLHGQYSIKGEISVDTPALPPLN
mgnify:CR=1 FL=1